MDKIHDLINRERRKRKLPRIYWSREMGRLARSQARECADRGYMIHSDRYAFAGGECLVGGKGNFSPRQAVNSWLRSKQGHREYILSPEVKKAGVGIAKRKGKMFVAWAFSSSSCRYPDCPAFKPKFKMPELFGLMGWVRRELREILIVAGIVLLLVLVLGGCSNILDNSPEEGNRLYGTYAATVGYDPSSLNPGSSVERTIAFKDDIMVVQDAYLGKTICKYFIPSDLDSAQIIRYTNVATGEEFIERFKYVAEFDCFTIGEDYSAVTYYKK